MAKNRFSFATSEDIVSVRARTMFNIELNANKEQTHTYKRWSEKATVVKYNSKVDTYNIIVSALNVSSSAQKSNRVIRDVKAIIPSKTHQFSPGDSILIGYESDKRESPVILGLRKSNSSQITVNGGGGGLSTPSITPPCDLRFINDDGETISTGGQIICNCSVADATGLLSCCLRIECAVGTVKWAWTGATGCLTSDCFNSAITTATNSRKFCISKGVCTPIDPDTGLPFLASQATTALVRCYRAAANPTNCNSGCNVFYYNCAGGVVSSKVSFCTTGGACGSFGPNLGCCQDPSITQDDIHDTSTSDIAALIPACGNQVTGSLVTGNDLAEQCGWYDWQNSGTNILLVTDADVLAVMRANGCCPCTTVDNTTVTARDETGRSITVTVKTQVTGGVPILDPAADDFTAECGG